MLAELLGEQVTLVDAAEAAAVAVRTLLSEGSLLSGAASPRHRFFVSDAPEKFETIGPLFLGTTIGSASLIQIEEY